MEPESRYPESVRGGWQQFRHRRLAEPHDDHTVALHAGLGVPVRADAGRKRVKWAVPRLVPAVLAILAVLAGGRLGAADAPAQPIPFSHQQHATALKLQCKMCHPNPDPGENM